MPKVRDRSGAGVKFNSVLVPPFVRRSPRMSAALPWLYLKGISTGDMREALAVLVGDQAKGLSANVVSRLKAEWAAEYAVWMKRDLSSHRYVCWWADGIHAGLRQEDDDARACLLVIMVVAKPQSRCRALPKRAETAAVPPRSSCGQKISSSRPVSPTARLPQLHRHVAQTGVQRNRRAGDQF